MKKNRLIKISIIVACFMLVAVFLEYNGYIWHTSLFTMKYSVKGIDVSHYQYDIDWKEVKEEEFKFAFIKATEGNDFVDNYFKDNWEEAKEAGVLRGAYHYYTIGSSGKEQAKNFINIVPKEEGALPPVIDIEESGLPKEVFKTQLKDYISLVEEHYGQKPILYVVYPLYDEYIKGDFEEYPIWIRDIVKPPNISDDREWIFWQYSNRGRINGIDAYVDLNVFKGKEEELYDMILKK